MSFSGEWFTADQNCCSGNKSSEGFQDYRMLSRSAGGLDRILQMYSWRSAVKTTSIEKDKFKVSMAINDGSVDGVDLHLPSSQLPQNVHLYCNYRVHNIYFSDFYQDPFNIIIGRWDKEL